MDTVESRDLPAIDDLTDRQVECLRLIGDGMSSKEIGRALGISPSTVDNHIHAAVAKLHVKNRWQAAQLLHPEWSNSSQTGDEEYRFLPPLGGKPNETSNARRLLQIISIAVVALIVVTAATASIIAAIHVFSGK